MQSSEIFKSVLEEGRNRLVDVVKRRLNTSLPPEQVALHNQVVEQGFVVIPNFISHQACDSMKAWIDEVVETNPKIWRDSTGSDNRVFFANLGSEAIDKFYRNSFVIDILSRYEKTGLYSGFTLANKVVYKDNNAGSGGGWHRDFVKRKQTKALLYLNDVTGVNGPFQYINGSHRFSSILKFQRQFKIPYNQFRFTDQQVANILDRYPGLLSTLTASKGTLVLVDTRGIHRGQPLQEGVRYALTNYYWFNAAIPRHIQSLNPFSG